MVDPNTSHQLHVIAMSEWRVLLTVPYFLPIIFIYWLSRLSGIMWRSCRSCLDIMCMPFSVSTCTCTPASWPGSSRGYNEYNVMYTGQRINPACGSAMHEPKRTSVFVSWVILSLCFFVVVILGGAPNYYPNSFSGPLDHPAHALSKTVVVNNSIMYMN
jgi:hypothetical protein